MPIQLRIWFAILTLVCALISAVGMAPQTSGWWWPLPGLWAAAAWGALGLSVWCAGCLTLLGVLTDYLTGAPIGAWPLSLLAAYGASLLIWGVAAPLVLTEMDASRRRRAAPGVWGLIASLPVLLVEAAALGVVLVASALTLAAASNLAGLETFWFDGVLYDLFATALLYPAARRVLTPQNARAYRR